MSNIFAFALWIVFDLAVIALGAGAFFTGFLTYIIGKKELKGIINAAVIIGFLCYTGALAMLGIDIGNPFGGGLFSGMPTSIPCWWKCLSALPVTPWSWPSNSSLLFLKTGN